MTHGTTFLSVLLLAVAHVRAADGGLRAIELTCEYASNPLGVQHDAPRFAWVLQSDDRGQVQTAYQVLVATSEQRVVDAAGDKWDSGKVASDASVGVTYRGKTLGSGETCWWAVRCWDRDGRPGPWSAPARFEMGLLKESDWDAQWIRAGGAIDYGEGRSGKSLLLNGTNQCVRIPHYAELKPARAITIAAWIRPAPALGADWRTIYRKDDGTARHLLALGQTGPLTGLWVGLGIAGKYVEFGAPASLEKLKDGKWHQVGATYDGAAIRLYVDGAPIGAKTVAGGLDTAGDAGAYIGANRSESEFFPGAIDDVRVYARALSGAEMRTLFDSGAGAEDQIVGWWKLDGTLANSAKGRGGEPVGASTASPLIRKEVQLPPGIRRARVYMSGLGWSELYVNGSKVGDSVLDPAATDYNKRALYVTHDVTSMLKPGKNVLGVMLGNGWFSEPPSPGYGDAPCLRFQMDVQVEDGQTVHVRSDPTWKVAGGPIVRNDIFGGETYDARLEKSGWLEPGYDDSAWQSAAVAPAPGGVMESQVMPPLKVTQTLRPIGLKSPAAGIHVYDMGQVFGGWVRMKVRGAAGTKVAIKYSARALPNGLADKTRHPEPRATDYYILKGNPDGEVYEPRFTFHAVRYVQIEGYPGTPTAEDVEGRVVHSAIDLSGDFACSNTLFNQIHRNAVWTLRNETYGILLDCLYREHWGWLEPGTSPSALFGRKHMPLFWEKYLEDARYAQHADGVIPDVIPAYPLKGRKTGDAAWAGNYPLVVWYVYQYYDDRRVLEHHYDSMKKWLGYLTSISSDNLIAKGYYGDHMLPGPAPGQEIFLSTETPPPLLWSGFYYRNASILTQVARILGRAEDERRYTDLAAAIKEALHAKWYDPKTGGYATNSQTSNLFALAIDVVPLSARDGVLRNIAADITRRGGHFHTGNVGTTSLMETSLADNGLGDLMHAVMNGTSYPGFGYMVSQGATTLWEAWGLRDDLGSGEESMGMWNSVEEFFYSDVAGIQGPSYFGSAVLPPGFRQIVIKPHVLGDMTWAKASIRTVRGPVASSWKRSEDTFSLEVTIPVGSTAQVSTPKRKLAAVIVTEGGRPVWNGSAFVPGVPGIAGATQAGDRIVVRVGSGAYAFSSSPVPGTTR